MPALESDRGVSIECGLSRLDGLGRGIHDGLKLPVRAFFVIGLDAFEGLEANIAGIAGPQALFLEAAAEQKRRHLVIGVTVERGAETIGRGNKVALFEERVAEIEVIERIVGIAVEGFPEIVDRLGKIAAAFGGGQVIVNLAERDSGGHDLERFL
jgi:hypothetical protein